MATAFLTEKEELLDRQPTPHPPYSQVNRYPDFPLDGRIGFPHSSFGAEVLQSNLQ